MFNGTNAKVTIPDSASLHLTTAMTLEAWVNPAASTPAWRDVLYKGDDNYYLEGASPSGAPGRRRRPRRRRRRDAVGSSRAAGGAWTISQRRMTAATLRLYMNGDQVASGPHRARSRPRSNPLQIGGDGLYGQYFNGMIDEARIYDTALTATQIQADMSRSGLNNPSAPTKVDRDRRQRRRRSTLLDRRERNVGGHRLPHRALPRRRLQQLHPDRGADRHELPDTGLTANVTYSYRVRAVNTAGKLGEYSSTASAFTGLTLSPRTATLTFTRTQQFVAQGGSATWSVDGVAGGNSTSGTITAAGLYSPPSAAGTHVVTGTAGAQSGSATVYVTNYPGIFTFHNDNTRVGANTAETVLTPANVNTSTFGKLFTFQTDGVAHASPLYVANLAIPGQGFHNVVYVATEHDSVYAFDADARSSTPIWKQEFYQSRVGHHDDSGG